MLQRSGLALALMLVLSSLTPGSAAQQPSTAASPQEEGDHQALRDLRPIYEQAVRENNIDLIRPHLHAEFNGIMVTGRQVSGFDQLQQYWRDIRSLIGEGGSYTTTLNPERSIIVGDLALARGTTDDVVRTNAGDEFRFQTMWSATLQREGGAWKIRYVQGTMDPIGNPFVREFGQRAVTRFSAVALLAGLIVGMAFGLIWQKRRMRRMSAAR